MAVSMTSSSDRLLRRIWRKPTATKNAPCGAETAMKMTLDRLFHKIKGHQL